MLGAADLARLDALFARLIWIPDGDLDALDAAAREYREIIGPPEDQSGGGSEHAVVDRTSGDGSDNDRDTGEDDAEGDRAPSGGAGAADGR